LPVAGVDRIHVDHVVHALHLLLNRRGDRLFERDGVRAHVSGAQLDFRRRNVRKLGDGKLDQGDDADHRHQD
jgi:hypothetical protein